MKADLVIATTTCFEKYGHVSDTHYRRRLFDLYVDSAFRTKDVDKTVCFEFSNEDGSGWNANYFRLLNRVTDMAPLCLIADSDSYFHPDWFLWLNDAIAKYPDAAGWSLYNSPRNITFVRDLEPGIFEKRHSTPFGLVYRTEDRPVSEPHGWFEEFITELPSKHSMGFVCPKISMIQHTGCYGLNNVPYGSADFDPLFPLNKECGLEGADRTGFESC